MLDEVKINLSNPQGVVRHKFNIGGIFQICYHVVYIIFILFYIALEGSGGIPTHV